MSDRSRFAAGADESLPEWTDEELAVLRTADDDRPPPTSLAATLAAVGAGGAVASVTAAAKGAATVASASSGVTAAKATGVVALTKWIGVVALGGVVVAGGAAIVQRVGGEARDGAPSKSDAVSGPHAPAHAVTPVAPVAPPPSATAPEPAVAEVPVAEAVVVPEAAVTEPGRAPQDTPSSAQGRTPAVRSQPDISLEIAAVDEARADLRAGRPGEALAALDRYDVRFGKGGALRVEVTALRIESLLRSGKRDRATSLATAFLAHHAKSPYAARVRALIGENPGPR